MYIAIINITMIINASIIFTITIHYQDHEHMRHYSLSIWLQLFTTIITITITITANCGSDDSNTDDGGK